MGASTGELAEIVRSAMENGDLEAFLTLCADDVHWGAPGDSHGGCHNRSQVRSWYEAAVGRGLLATVTEVMQGPASLLVGLTISGSPAAEEEGGQAKRWQVLTIRDGRITDICGFDDRTEAARWAGMPIGPPPEDRTDYLMPPVVDASVVMYNPSIDTCDDPHSRTRS